jgi:DNA-binding NtrC family response regulator
MAMNILVVEDERNLGRSMVKFLTREDHEVTLAEDGEHGWNLVQRIDPQLVILDCRLPRLTGMELFQRIRKLNPEVCVVMMTAYGTIEAAVEAMKLGAFDFLEKPIDMDRLTLIVGRAEEHLRLKQEVTYLRERDRATFFWDSSAMAQVIERLDQLAQFNSHVTLPTVLLVGETGSGKTVVARRLAEQSGRRDKPFVEVNCLTLPPTLIEAELFGYEKGAFTDARGSKIGLFEAADRGTLFLDEIGDLPLTLQGKLLTAIDNKLIRRIGSIRDRRVDVWVIAATNRNLEVAVKEGIFRADLYFRISGLTLRLPALRERGEDIVLLADHFLGYFSKQYGKPKPELTQEAKTALLSYPWPGNIRELSHAMEHAVLLSAQQILGPQDLPMVYTAALSDHVAAPTASGDAAHEQWNLYEVERQLIERALRHTHGNLSQTAKLLGITRDILRYRIEKYGISHLRSAER